MSATELLGETKTFDNQLETATARDAREDSVLESAEGDGCHKKCYDKTW